MIAGMDHYGAPVAMTRGNAVAQHALRPPVVGGAVGIRCVIHLEPMSHTFPDKMAILPSSRMTPNVNISLDSSLSRSEVLGDRLP